MQQGLSDLKTEEIKRGAKRKIYGYTGLERTLKSNKPSHLEKKPNKAPSAKDMKTALSRPLHATEKVDERG